MHQALQVVLFISLSLTIIIFMLNQIFQQFIQVYNNIKSQVINLNERVNGIDARMSSFEQMLNEVQARQNNSESIGDLSGIHQQLDQLM